MSGLAVAPWTRRSEAVARIADSKMRLRRCGRTVHSLFRSMKVDDGRPLLERSARALGVRIEGPDRDVEPDAEGDVHPQKGGMSVAPDDPLALQTHRRPPEFGGTGKDPVWQISDDTLPAALCFRRDAPSHGLVEPRSTMPLIGYEDRLAETRDSWEPHL